MFLLLALSAPARAGLTQAELDTVAVAPPPGARVPLTLAFDTAGGRRVTVGEALDGRPALLLPFDPACRSICGPSLSVLSGALGEAGLRPGRDVQLLLVAIGGRDPASARAFAGPQLGEAAAAAILTGPPEAVATLLDAVGYRFAPDPDNEAVAHPAALLALTADGRVARVLSSLALNPSDLRLAAVEAGEGRVGAFADRLKLLCYGFDAVHGIYTSRITSILRAGGVATVVLMLLAGWWMSRRRRPAGAAS